MSECSILTIDLLFQNKPGTIGVYILPHNRGCALVDSGPTSTIPQLLATLKEYGFAPSQVTDVLLTHIHLDHAGAADWFAEHGSRIHVHPQGSAHLINPQKLLASAGRVYGDQLEILWGVVTPVPESNINALKDNLYIDIDGLTIQAIDVPGHASHHLAYMIDGSCFCGDVGGVRVHNQKYISLPTPPPEFNLEQWRISVLRLIDLHPRQIIPAHFGIYCDPDWHLQTLLSSIDSLEKWMETTLPRDLSDEQLRKEFFHFEVFRAKQAGLRELTFDAQQTANPYTMSADSIARYWMKFRQANIGKTP